MNDVAADMAANVAQQKRRNNKCYASAFNNIQIQMIGRFYNIINEWLNYFLLCNKIYSVPNINHMKIKMMA